MGFKTLRHRMFLAAALCGLAACHPVVPQEGTFTATIDPVETPRNSATAGLQVTRGFGPPDADPNSCYGREIRPAIIETVTEQVQISPAGEAGPGAPQSRAIFRTETQQRILEDRQDIWFETPCALDQDRDYVASLQRALRARGLYGGPITAVLDPGTVAAIRAYQRPQGLDSGVLSLAAARQLGLSLWDPDLAAGRRAE